MASIPLLHLSLAPHPSPAKRPLINLTAFLSHPLRSTVRIPPPSLNRLRAPQIVSASNSTTPATDRLISAVAYFLPFFNGIQYGRFLFAQYPSLAIPFQPILPIFSLYRSVPYASFVSFFALYLGVVRNPNFSRYVRFNALQAVVLDVLLVVPLLLQRILDPGQRGIGFKLMVMGYNAMFVFVAVCFVYSLVCTILGKTPYLPFVAEAAGRQL